MTAISLSDLLASALSLPKEDRASVAKKLIESLDDEDDLVSEEEAEAAWAVELERRARQVEEDLNAGRPVGRTWEEVRAELFKQSKRP